MPGGGNIYLKLNIKCRVHKVNIFLVQLFPQQLHGFTEPLEVYDLPLPQEFYDIVHIRIVRKPQDVVIGHAGLLFCCKFV